MQTTTKGMVQVAGRTYRIVRLAAGSYDVVRVLDDQRVGSFRMGSPLVLSPTAIDVELLRVIARVAIQQARTTWVGILPSFE